MYWFFNDVYLIIIFFCHLTFLVKMSISSTSVIFILTNNNIFILSIKAWKIYSILIQKLNDISSYNSVIIFLSIKKFKF